MQILVAAKAEYAKLQIAVSLRVDLCLRPT